jgi:RNA polymerase sigma-32 factor
MHQAAALPFLTAESGLRRYLDEIRRFPMLEPQEEFMLAKSGRQHGDCAAAHKLVTSHLRLVVKIAMGYREYGLPISEIIRWWLRSRNRWWLRSRLSAFP